MDRPVLRFDGEPGRLYDATFSGVPTIGFAAGSFMPLPARTAFGIIASAVTGSGFGDARVEIVGGGRLGGFTRFRHAVEPAAVSDGARRAARSLPGDIGGCRHDGRRA